MMVIGSLSTILKNTEVCRALNLLLLFIYEANYQCVSLVFATKEFAESLEAMVAHHIIPEMGNVHGFIRAKVRTHL